MTDFIQLGNQLSAPRPLSFASKWPLTTPLKWFTTNWSPRRLVTLAPPAANTKNVAAIATAVPPHTIYCEGLIQTWVTEVESIWLYTDLYLFLNSYLRKISQSSWLFSLFFSLPALLPLWQTSEVWFKLWPIALKYQNPLDWLIGPELACIATSPTRPANPWQSSSICQSHVSPENGPNCRPTSIGSDWPIGF